MPSRCSPGRCHSTRIPRSRKPPKLPVRTGSSRPAPPTGASKRVPGPPSHAQSEEKETDEANPHLIIPPSSVPQLVGQVVGPCLPTAAREQKTAVLGEEACGRQRTDRALSAAVSLGRGGFSTSHLKARPAAGPADRVNLGAGLPLSNWRCPAGWATSPAMSSTWTRQMAEPPAVLTSAVNGTLPDPLGPHTQLSSASPVYTMV